MIKRVITYGTSNTAGGGFEFDSTIIEKEYWKGLMGNSPKTRGELLKSIYSETPLTQDNYSWPGQLKRLFKENNLKIEVQNISKQGYGNDRIYRKFFEDFDLHTDYKNNIYIFEFSDLSRKEFYFNPLKNHIVLNYGINYNRKHLTMAESYFYDSKDKIKLLDDNLEFIHTFRENFMDYDIEIKDISRRLLWFLSFLDFYEVNYYISSPPQIIHPQYESHIEYSDKLIEFGFKNKKQYNSFHDFASQEGIKIIDETNGGYTDVHPSLFATKTISKIIWNKLVQDNIINEDLYDIPEGPDFSQTIKKSIM